MTDPRPPAVCRERAPAVHFAEREIANACDAFATGDLGTDELEAEAEFWLRVKECAYCDGQLCTIHYGQYVGR